MTSMMNPVQEAFEAVNFDPSAIGASESIGGTLAMFYDRPVIDQKETDKVGRPVFKYKTFVEIRTSSDTRTVVDEPVRKTYGRNEEDPRVKFAKAWFAYQNKKTGLVSGTPIEEFVFLNRLQIATLKHIGIVTVEQLAELGEASLKDVGPDARKLKERAKQFIAGADDTERQLRGQITALENDRSSLQAQVDQLKEQVARIINEEASVEIPAKAKK